jgi:nicotinate-nucleotide pyrophosphorylase (carboxylating)
MALQEDIGPGDVTSLLTVLPETCSRAQVRARSPLVLSGLAVFQEVFFQVDPEVRVEFLALEGEMLQAGQPACELSGRAQSLLTGERTGLNFLMRLSGVATWTRKMVEAMGPDPGPVLMDTRKTTPGFRALERAAVIHGGGCSHRFGLFDGILIKDNHIQAGGGLEAVLARARQSAPHGMKIEVEVENLVQVEAALKAGADILLLDNMSPAMLRAAVIFTEKFFEPRKRPVLLEASGGINLSSIGQTAQSGVDFISAGALTHSAPAADLGLDWL